MSYVSTERPNFHILSFLFLFYIALPAIAGIERPTPKIVCDEPEFIFPPTQNTEILTNSFTLINEGEAPLLIGRIRSGCGCMITRLGKDALAPGEAAVLTARLNLKNRSGKQFHRIMVESNDPDEPRFTLAVIGEAIASLEVIPDRIYWGNLYVSAAAEKSCEIRFHERDESYINSAVTPNKSFAVELTTLKPRRNYKLVIRTVPPLQPGRFETPVRLETDHPRYKTIEVPLIGRVVEDVYAIPDEIYLDSKDGGPVTRAVLVYSGVKTPFKILKVEPPLPDIQTTIRKMSLAGGYRIDLRNINVSKDLDGKPVVITTDCEKMPRISVPFKIATTNSP